MKIFITLLLIIPFFVQAQNITVKSFSSIPNDMTARVTKPVTDQNGDKCALIKIRTSQKDFVFEGDMLGITKTIQEVGEIWVYIPPKAKRLTIKHSNLGVLQNYLYPEQINEAVVYIMEITTGKVTTIVEDVDIPMQWVTIATAPEGADIYIDNQYIGITPYQKKMEVKNYNYRIEKDMYYTYAGVINLTNDSKENVTITLQPNFGFLNISTYPETGASIAIDDISIPDTTPILSKKLISGKHNLTVKKVMFKTKSVDFEILDNEISDLKIRLEPNFATVNILSLDNADIFIDDKKVAAGKYSGRLMPGLHTFESRLKNHTTSKKQLSFISGDTQDLNLHPKPITGTVEVVTSPFDVNIVIDGNPYGTTPNTINELIIGNHTIELSKDGFGSITENITVSKNETTSINRVLEKGKQVTIKTTPTNAQLIIDGKPVGDTPFSGYLTFGHHNLEMAKDSYSLKKTIEINPTNESNYSFNLREAVQKRKREMRQSNQKSSNFVLYSYDKLSVFGIDGGSLNVYKIGWFARFKTNHLLKVGEDDYNDDATYTGKIALSNVYFSGGITTKLLYPIWFFAGLELGYNSEVYQSNWFLEDGTKVWTKGPDIDSYGFELNPTCGLFYKYSFLAFKYGISYRFMQEKGFIHQFGIGYNFN